MAIKMVYQLQADEENWTRWPDLIEHYQYNTIQYNTILYSREGK